MASSIQVVGGHAETLNDLDLIALVCLLGQEIECQQVDLKLLLPFVARWQAGLKGYGPGTIDLQLEQIASSDEAKDQLLTALASVEERLEQYGNMIPATVLNKLCAVPGVDFRDYPTSLLSSAAAKLAGLVS